jgi:hypothetical protein
MASKHNALVKENRHLYAENDALRATIVKLKDRLENCQMIRQEQASYIQSLWEDNRRVRAELRLCKRQEERN